MCSLPDRLLTPTFCGPTQVSTRATKGPECSSRFTRADCWRFRRMVPGVFLMPKGEHTFTSVMTEEARVAFEVGNGPATALTFEQPGKAMRYVRVG